MHPFIAQLLHSSLDLRLCDVLQTPQAFTVRSRRRGPRLVIAALFGLPGIHLLVQAFGSHSAVLVVPAILFSPVLLGLAALFGLALQEKTWDRSGACEERLQLLHWHVSERLPAPPGGARVLLAPLKDSRGLGYAIAVSGSGCSGFTIYRDHGAASAFAQQLARFLGVPFQDDVPPALRITR